jgi:hypothetical protein
MTLTAARAIQHIEHALAGKSGLDALDMANQAGRYVVGMRNWNWLRGASATVGVTSGQTYASLPSDLKRVDAIEQTNSLLGTVEWVSLADLLKYRQSGLPSGTFSYWAAVTWGRQLYTTAGTEKPGRPSPRIELYPTPTTTNSTAFTVFYSRGWIDFVEDNDEATIPTFLESLYLAACRAFALGYEEESTADVNQRLALLARGPLWDVAMREDLATQPHLGMLRGGMVGPSSYINRWSGSTITYP